jgi:hypothetical protein
MKLKKERREKNTNKTERIARGRKFISWHEMNRAQRREMTRKIQAEDLSLEVVHPHAAGIDIGNESHYVAVPSTRDDKPVRRFGCTTAELKAMAAWLQQCGIRTVAMQSTGVYWIAVYDILEAAGLEVYLVNARETKKSDQQPIWPTKSCWGHSPPTWKRCSHRPRIPRPPHGGPHSRRHGRPAGKISNRLLLA